jgi:hypothetical protein
MAIPKIVNIFALNLKSRWAVKQTVYGDKNIWKQIIIR